MSEAMYLSTIGLPIAALLIIFGMRYYAAVAQARLRHDSDQDYRVLAQQAAETQARSATALASIDATLADLRARVASVETVLKQVE
jgi:hypothetical protein